MSVTIQRRIGSSCACLHATIMILLALCLLSLADESSRAAETDADDGIEHSQTGHVYVLDVTPTHLQAMIGGLSAPHIGSGCSHWPDAESLVAMLVPIPGGTWLFMTDSRGRGGESSKGLGGLLLRKYPVINYRQSGSPASGEIVFLVRQSAVEAELPCIERFRQVVVQWFNMAGVANPGANAGKLVVRDVSFSKAAVTASNGEAVKTGDTVVKLLLTETLISMVYREMIEQSWGIAGGMISGILIMALAMFTRLGRRIILLLLRLKVLNASSRRASADDTDRLSEADALADSSPPNCSKKGSTDASSSGRGDGP